MSGVWQLKVRDEFSAAHALRHYEGKCERLHGHNFTVEVCVEGSILDPATEMLVDFKILKGILKEILGALDHYYLDDIAPFDKMNPTSENLARHIFNEFSRKLGNNCPARVTSATVWEKPAQCATYMETRELSAQ